MTLTEPIVAHQDPRPYVFIPCTVTMAAISSAADEIDWAQGQGLAWDQQDSPEGERWGCRLEVYPVNPAEQPIRPRGRPA